MAVMRGRDQRSAAIAVGVLKIGAGAKRHLQNFDAAFGARIEIRRIGDLVLCVDVRAGGDQRTRGVGMVGVSGDQQSRAALGVTRIDFDAG